MTCLEAQTKIMAFIDNKLTGDELSEFVKHVKNCKNCSEELEIYYTLLVGMKQLDNNEELSTDFKRDLDRKLDESMHKISNTKNLKTSSVCIVFACVLAGLIIGYNNFLNWVYHKEQELKLSKQTEYYYLDTFGDTLLNDSRIRIRDITVQTTQQPEDNTAVFYEKIHQYHVNQTIAGEGGSNE